MSTITRIAQFTLFALIASLILFGIHYFVFRSIVRIFKLDALTWVWVPILLTLSFVVAMILVRTLPNAFARWYYVASSVWLGTIFLLFSTFVLYELYRLLAGHDSRTLALATIAFALCLALYGVIHAHTIVTRVIPLTSSRAPHDMTVVQLSDLHVGTIHNEAYLKRVVDMANSAKPDIVLITGDLFDGSAPIDAPALSPLQKLTAPVYFSIGNHEVYEGLDKVRTAIKGTSITLLENTSAIIGNVQIVGINDPADQDRPALADILNTLSIDQNFFTIFMSHSPVKWDAIRTAGGDLMLSGHTHNGQIMPFNLLVKIFYPKIKGLYEADGKYLYTSPGTGTWGPPMRIGSTAEVTVFKIKPKTPVQ
jgi:predicted MPP superfamily phosphohydrolase